MLRIILLAADVPVVRVHGLFATCEVFLGEEGCLVGCQLRQVLGAGLDCRFDSGEACPIGPALAATPRAFFLKKSLPLLRISEILCTFAAAKV